MKNNKEKGIFTWFELGMSFLLIMNAFIASATRNFQAFCLTLIAVLLLFKDYFVTKK